VFSLLPVSSHDARPSDAWHLVEAGSRRRQRSVDGRSTVVGLTEPAHRDGGAVDGDDAVHDPAAALPDDARSSSSRSTPNPSSTATNTSPPCTPPLRRSSLLLSIIGAFSFAAAADKSALLVIPARRRAPSTTLPLQHDADHDGREDPAAWEGGGAFSQLDRGGGAAAVGEDFLGSMNAEALERVGPPKTVGPTVPTTLFTSAGQGTLLDIRASPIASQNSSLNQN
jgi:hypothetical protein